jgi:phenylpropionate dioxygenase-like ring-hydroxylating dioxygenase large terminal subunit
MHYVRNTWYVAAWTQDIDGSTPHAITILNEPIALYRTASGRVVALEDRCVHRMAPLSLGRCEGERLRCSYHGLLFDPDGRVAQIPGQDVIPPQAKVKSYPVVERHDWIWIWMGDQDQADPALIPPAIGPNDPDHLMFRGQLDYAAEARLINDNLLDFSHLAFVHPESFGATEDWANTHPKVTVLERGIRVERWLPDQPAMSSAPGAERCDIWNAYDYYVPGILLLPMGFWPVGSAEASGFGPPDASLAKYDVSFSSQAVTPMTDQTSRYFFCWGPHRDYGGEKERDELHEIAHMAFAEDRVIIEAQQMVINRSPNARIMPTGADKAVTLYNRLVDRLVRSEGQAVLDEASD